MIESEIIILIDELFKRHAEDIIKKEERLKPNKVKIRVHCLFYELNIFIMIALKNNLEFDWIDKIVSAVFCYTIKNKELRPQMFKSFQNEYMVFNEYNKQKQPAQYFMEYFYKVTHTKNQKQLFYDAVEKMKFILESSDYLNTECEIYENWFKENIKELIN